MQEPFFKERMLHQHGIDVLVPSDADQDDIHRIIFNELCLGEISETSRALFLNIIGRLATQGASAVVLGCTEIGLLIQQNQTQTPLFDTTQLHAESAVDFATHQESLSQ